MGAKAQAKVPGETETIQGTIIVKAEDEAMRARRLTRAAAEAAIACAIAGALWGLGAWPAALVSPAFAAGGGDGARGPLLEGPGSGRTTSRLRQRGRPTAGIISGLRRRRNGLQG